MNWNRSFILSIVLCACSACSMAIKAYPGDTLPDSKLALIRGYDTFCNGKVLISDLDDQYTGLWLNVPEGTHHMKVTVESIPFTPEDPDLNPSYECNWISHYRVEFAVKPKREYWFYANHIADSKDTFTVYQSSPDDQYKGEPIAASVTRTSLRRACFIGGQYEQCLHH